MSTPPTFIEEALAGIRGSALLLFGNRAAPSYFDLSQRGLVGAMIGFIGFTAANAYLPRVLGLPGAPGMITFALVVAAILVAMQFGICALILRQMRRLDGLVPYLVAYGWTRAALTIPAIILPFLGMDDMFLVALIGIATIVIEINIARLVVTLSPGQIALFLLGQLIGVSLCLVVIGMVVPLPPEITGQPSVVSP